MANNTNKFRRARLIKGIKQKDLATLLGVSCVSVSQWENGKTLPNVTRLKDVAEALGTTVDYLIGDTERRIG